MRIAIIDLGTNTFNLLLAQTKPNNLFNTIYSGKQAAKLGEGGINKGIITHDATNRAIQVLNNFRAIIADNGGADKIVAISTSAVRTAQNKAEFIAAVKQNTGIDVSIISGNEEAAFIYEGVKQTFDIGHEIVVTLDIGGGSNEFIIADGQRIYWKHSFQLGVARMLEMFRPENPITPETLRNIEKYIDTELHILWNEARKYPLKTLIGSSGSFDTYRSMLTNGERGSATSFIIPVNRYIELHQTLVQSTTEEREQIKSLEPMRVEMIVLASIFTHFVVCKLGIQRITQSDYSLKEGVMSLLAQGELNFTQ